MCTMDNVHTMSIGHIADNLYSIDYIQVTVLQSAISQFDINCVINLFN